MQGLHRTKVPHVVGTVKVPTLALLYDKSAWAAAPPRFGVRGNDCGWDALSGFGRWRFAIAPQARR